MEGQDSNLLGISGEIIASGTSTVHKPSGTHDQDENVKRERDSPQVSQSESRLRNPCQDVVEISSDDELQIIDVNKEQNNSKAPAYGKEQKQQSAQSSAGRTSPKDVTCSVCLSEYDNKAFLDKCFHAFCYFCILQWSEIVRTCPLCKSSFSSIIHSVKSMDNYQQHYLSKPNVHAPVTQQQSHSDGTRFRYRTTLVEGNQQQQRTQRRQQEGNESNAWGQRAQRRQAHLSAQRSRRVIGRERRRTIYSSNLWVQGVTQAGHPRQRDISPEFFRANPACSHRLIPWLTRDLRVLLNDEESHVNFVLQIILSLITKVDLSSEEFCCQLRPFLFDRTEQFIHEFISFARSPFDVNAYDERAQYNWPDESHEQEVVRDTPTVFHSHTAGWQTPVPGPSGVSLLELSQTDWSRDSPVPLSEITSWSPSSLPGTTGVNEPRQVRTVAISSSSSQALSFEHSESDEPTIPASKRSTSASKTTSTDETAVKSRKTHSHRHHGHSHKSKHKHKRKHKRKLEEKHKHSSKHNNTSRRSNSLESGDSNIPGPSRRISIDSSTSERPVEVIFLSDSSVSPVLSGAHSKAARIDHLRYLDKKESVTRSRSRSRCESKEKRGLQRKYKHRSRSRSEGEDKGGLQRKGRHQSRSRSRSEGKRKRSVHGKNRSQSPDEHSESHSRRDHCSSTTRRKWKSHDRSRSRNSASHSRRRTGEGGMKGDRHSRSRSRHSDSRSRERKYSKRETQSDNHDALNSESFSSRSLALKKGKHDREKSRSRSRSPSQSRSHRKSDSKTRSKNFQKGKNSLHSPSSSSTRCEAASSSQSPFSRSKSRSSRRHSRSRSPISRNSRSHSRAKRFTQSPLSRSPSRSYTDFSESRSKSRYKESIVSSASEPPESNSHSSEDIRKEIEDLELRITADKKRLLKLLIKQERTTGDGVTFIDEETENAPCEGENNL